MMVVNEMQFSDRQLNGFFGSCQLESIGHECLGHTIERETIFPRLKNTKRFSETNALRLTLRLKPSHLHMLNLGSEPLESNQL